MKRARFLLSPELLRELLHLPVTTNIVNAKWDSQGLIEIAVMDEGLPVDGDDGDIAPVVKPMFKNQEPVVFLGWDRT